MKKEGKNPFFFYSKSENKLNGKFKNSWVEDSFDIEKDIDERLSVNHTKKYIQPNISKKWIFYFSLFIFLIFTVISGKIFFLQITKGQEYFILAENNRTRDRSIPAERGIIYDRKGTEMVQNIPSFSILISPRDLPKEDSERWSVIEQLANLIEVEPSSINDVIEKYKNYFYETITVQEDIDYDLAIKISTKIDALPGIIVHSDTKRKYLFNNKGSSTSHLVGYLGKLSPEEYEKKWEKGYQPSDNIGKTGIEKYYEDELRGIYGRKKIEVNSAGREQLILAEEPPIPGNNLKLTIDLEMQKKLEDILTSSLKELNKKRASGIVMDPQNGEILAMVSLPSFNNNDFSGGISNEDYKKYISNEDNPLFNRSVAGTYPSGSTVKPLIAVAALAEKIITPNTSFLSTGGLQINRWFFPDWQAGGHGRTNVRKAIAWSVNTFFYYIGGGYKDFVGLGVDRITEYLRKFGLAKKTGIDLPGESAGFLPSKEWKKEKKDENWYVGDTYNLSIGQGDLLVTPLQVTNWISTIANGGIVNTPHLVKSFKKPNEKQYKNFEFKQTKIKIDPYYFKIVKLGMKDCVDVGSCGTLRLLPFSTGGKTGTAQWSSTKETHAWFTAFAPYEEPKITVTILVEEGGGGASISMPIAYKFLRWWGENYLST